MLGVEQAREQFEAARRADDLNPTEANAEALSAARAVLAKANALAKEADEAVRAQTRADVTAGKARIAELGAAIQKRIQQGVELHRQSSALCRQLAADSDERAAIWALASRRAKTLGETIPLVAPDATAARFELQTAIADSQIEDATFGRDSRIVSDWFAPAQRTFNSPIIKRFA